MTHYTRDWRDLLFPDASDNQFADAYAQTVTFAILLGRSEGADPLTLDSAESALAAEHSLLSRALQILTDQHARTEIWASLDLLIRIVGAVQPSALNRADDPWIYFYEDFLAVYDPKLRKDIGAYYTPIPVVRAQVRLVDDLLTKRLGKHLGFADPGVITLDPAVGTGTYLLGIVEHALKRVKREHGPGAVPGKASELARNMYGFELLVGPYAVAELRLSRTLRDLGGNLPNEGTHVYLTDTLESPNATVPQISFYLRPIADQHTRALRVKSEVPVIVCIGNPPYDRHRAATRENRAQAGGWVRWGDPGVEEDPIFQDFVGPAIAAGHGVHLKWLYNQYIYFWRWAFWKVFESRDQAGPGVVSFITAASYLFGDAFVGMREHLRRKCDEVWIIDLGGEGRGARKEENVFAIKTPVAIAIAVRFGESNESTPAVVRYTRLQGSRDEKLRSLDELKDYEGLKWDECSSDWQAPFLPAGRGAYFTWPIIRDLFPWQHSGAQFFRTWPIAPEAEMLSRRWNRLLHSDDRAQAFKESRDRKVTRDYLPLLEVQKRQRPLAALENSTPPPNIVRYGFRSFDRQYTFADSRLGDVMKPVLWELAEPQGRKQQVFLVSQLWQVLGSGPALTCSSYVPDFHYFKGSFGGKDVIPMYRGRDGSLNVVPGLAEMVAESYGYGVEGEDIFGYVYGILSQPAFTERFREELSSRELRVPITLDGRLFRRASNIGKKLLWLHTYGECFVSEDRQQGQVPEGAARCLRAVPSGPEEYPNSFSYVEIDKVLKVGDGMFGPVERSVFEFEVSGLKVVQSWLKYRMRDNPGRKSSPLDDVRPLSWTSQFTTELLQLLWVLEETVHSQPAQERLLLEIIDGPLLNADTMPAVPDDFRYAPSLRARGLFD